MYACESVMGEWYCFVVVVFCLFDCFHLLLFVLFCFNICFGVVTTHCSCEVHFLVWICHGKC